MNSSRFPMNPPDPEDGTINVYRGEKVSVRHLAPPEDVEKSLNTRDNRGYTIAGIVHKGEYVLPGAYSYPKWTKNIKPEFLRRVVRRVFRKHDPEAFEDFMRKLLGRN